METVEKIWGYEEIVENNEMYCMKFLIFNHGWKNSWHYHYKKDEMFYILEGKFHLITSTFYNIKEGILNVGDSVRIRPRTLHRLTGLNNYNKVLEVSNHFDDKDVQRYEAGREVYGDEECQLNSVKKYLEEEK